MPTLTVPPPTATPTAAAPTKKPFIRRHLLDHSQRVRHAVQIAFLAFNAWLGLEFILWVRYYETNGQSVYIDRPAGVEGWLPIAGLMNLKYFLSTHHVSAIHPAAMVLLVIFLISSWLLKKSFCSWLCPIGTASEYLWHLGQQLFHRSLLLPRWLDIPLRSLKYILLAFFVYVVATLDADGLQQFLLAPFGIIADVKMLNFFRHMSLIGIAVILTLVLLSIMIQNVWCRFLCPYGALMGLVSILSPIKIRRDQAACIDCNKCTHACPSHLPVAELITIRSAECTGCLSCIAACPAENALNFALPPRANATYAVHTFPTNPETSPAARSLTLSNARWHNRTLQPRTVVLLLAILFFGLITAARTAHHWQTNLPRSTYQQLVPHADDYNH
jgi:polyferredoxin